MHCKLPAAAFLLPLVLLGWPYTPAVFAGVRVPSHSAYLDPDLEAFEIAPGQGVSEWKDPKVTALEDPVWTFYMACGWHRGYFGMQVNSPTERRIIFSVWDSGHEPVGRDKVETEDRVVLAGKGDGVEAEDFGNEGTGGHSHLVFPWRTGETQRFLARARPVDSTHTIYSGYFFDPGAKKWKLISSWKAPKDGGYFRGLHSFSENFGGANGHLRRKALYGNQWVRTADGQWHEITTATFSHDPTGKADRLDRFMGIEHAQFFLSHGGFIPGSSRFGEKFDRPAAGKPPADLPQD